MFNEITGNADLYAEGTCKCYVYCNNSCSFLCTDDIPTATVQNHDLLLTSELLTIPIP
jgi:hypothetical protein